MFHYNDETTEFFFKVTNLNGHIEMLVVSIKFVSYDSAVVVSTKVLTFVLPMKEHCCEFLLVTFSAGDP